MARLVVYYGFDIELVGGIAFQVNGYAAVVGQKCLGAFHGFGIDILQAFQFTFGPADQGPQCNGNGEAHHARSGNAHAHGVLQDVGT